MPKNLNPSGTSFARSLRGGMTLIRGKAIFGESAQSSRTSPQAAPVLFTPERAVAAIAFHLIDEGITNVVSPESIQRTLNRLRHESFVLTISARAWASMSNCDRLRRLLDETSTEAALLPDDTVILAHRARKS